MESVQVSMRRATTRKTSASTATKSQASSLLWSRRSGSASSSGSSSSISIGHGQDQRGTRRVRTHAGAGNRRRAQAGLIIDNFTEQQIAEESLLFFQDEEQNGTNNGEVGNAIQSSSLVSFETNESLDEEAFQGEQEDLLFDFEAEKTKLLKERKQLEDILERISEHERNLKGFMEESKANTEETKLIVEAKNRSSATSVKSSNGLAAAAATAAPSTSSSSTASPALMRRDRYRTSLQRQKETRTKTEAEGAMRGEKQEKSKRKTRKASKKKQQQKRVLAESNDLEDKMLFVSTTSEESLSMTSSTGSKDAVTTMLNERKHLSLLNREEEARLIKKAQFCFKVENAIQELNNIHGTFPTYEQLSLALYGSKDKKISATKLRKKHLEAMEARRFMLDHNVRLVVHLAHRYRNKGVTLGDLVQEGIQGLLTAIEKFDLSRNLKFSTYATWWIKQSLIRGICNYSRDVRLPVHITDTFQKMNKIQREKGTENGQIKYSVEELADMMGCKVNKLQNVLESTRSAISFEVLCGISSSISEGHDSLKSADILSSSSGDGSGGNIEDALTVNQSDDVGEKFDAELYEKILQDDVDAVLKMLPPRERNILRMRFGLTPIDDMCLSLVDIGAAYGLTRERVRQMEARALNKLRQPRLSTKLKKYIEPEGQIGSDPEA